MITFREKDFSEVQKEFTVKPSLKAAYGVAKKIFKPKSSKLARGIIKANEKLGKAEVGINSAALNPGSAVKDVGGKLIENPLASSTYIAGTIASKGLAPMSIPTAAIAGVEGNVYKKLGINTKKVSKKFREGKLGKLVEDASNVAVNAMKSIG